MIPPSVASVNVDVAASPEGLPCVAVYLHRTDESIEQLGFTAEQAESLGRRLFFGAETVRAILEPS